MCNMKLLKINQNTSWVIATSVAGAVKRAPRFPGLYAFGAVRRMDGLPVEMAWVYVGRATGAAGLKGRLRQHEPYREANAALRDWLITADNVEVWFRPTGSAREAIEMEAALIYELNPIFNTLGCPPASRSANQSTKDVRNEIRPTEKEQ
jgi:excinuclease UvrABC nuclease subunit